MAETVGPFHFLNKLDRLKDVTFAPKEGLVVDELCLADRAVDDVKGLLDVVKTRDVHCRNKDGTIPAGVARILTTNWPWESFWPPEAFQAQHVNAIRRRVLWVNVLQPCPRHHRQGPTAPVRVPLARSAASRDEEDEDEQLRAMFDDDNV